MISKAKRWVLVHPQDPLLYLRNSSKTWGSRFSWCTFTSDIANAKQFKTKRITERRGRDFEGVCRVVQVDTLVSLTNPDVDLEEINNAGLKFAIVAKGSEKNVDKAELLSLRELETFLIDDELTGFTDDNVIIPVISKLRTVIDRIVL